MQNYFIPKDEAMSTAIKVDNVSKYFNNPIYLDKGVKKTALSTGKYKDGVYILHNGSVYSLKIGVSKGYVYNSYSYEQKKLGKLFYIKSDKLEHVMDEGKFVPVNKQVCVIEDRNEDNSMTPDTQESSSTKKRSIDDMNEYNSKASDRQDCISTIKRLLKKQNKLIGRENRALGCDHIYMYMINNMDYIKTFGRYYHESVINKLFELGDIQNDDIKHIFNAKDYLNRFKQLLPEMKEYIEKKEANMS